MYLYKVVVISYYLGNSKLSVISSSEPYKAKENGHLRGGQALSVINFILALNRPYAIV